MKKKKQKGNPNREKVPIFNRTEEEFLLTPRAGSAAPIRRVGDWRHGGKGGRVSRWGAPLIMFATVMQVRSRRDLMLR